jgi:hypothetical protein
MLFNPSKILEIKNRLCLSVIATVFLAINIQAQSKKMIFPVFTPEKQLNLTTKLKKDYYEGKKLSTRQLYEYNYLLTVLSKDSNGITILKATYKGIRFITDNRKEGKITGFDSQYPDSMVNKSRDENTRATNDLYRQFNSAMLGQSFTVYLNKKGEIEKVTGVDSASDYALIQVKGRQEEYMQGFRAAIKSSDENKEAKDNIRKAFDYITPRPAAVGESWVKSNTTDIGDINVNYTLGAARTDSIQVSIAANVLNQQYKMTINKKGTFTIDARSGLLLNASIREDIISTPANPNQIRMSTSENYILTN